MLDTTRLLFFPGRVELPDPELLVERLLKRRTFRPDPQGTNLMFAFFAQHFTHQFFKTYNRMGLGFTKALDHGVSSFLPRSKINIIGNYILVIFITCLKINMWVSSKNGLRIEPWGTP